MNLILFEQNELSPEAVLRLTGERAAHVREVIRAQTGARLRVGQVGGQIGFGEVQSVTSSHVQLRVVLSEQPQPLLPTDLFLALPRPQMLKRILEHVSAIGVRRIWLVGSHRVEKSYFSSPILKEQSLRELLLRGLEQSRGTSLPEVHVISRFNDGLESFVNGADRETIRLLAAPSASAELGEIGIKLGRETPIALAIGPEGGFVRTEEEAFAVANFQPFSLGERILRVESAVTFALGQLQMLRSLNSARQGGGEA